MINQEIEPEFIFDTSHKAKITPKNELINKELAEQMQSFSEKTANIDKIKTNIWPSIFIICSQYTDKKDFFIHGYETSTKNAIIIMEHLALTELKRQKGLKPEDDLPSPLHDTVPLTEICSGYTIRYRENTSNIIIDVIKIEKEYTTVYSFRKRRVYNVVRYFKIIEVKRGNSFNLKQNMKPDSEPSWKKMNESVDWGIPSSTEILKTISESVSSGFLSK